MGGRIHRSGLAKKKGGIGRHVTKVVKRSVSPNLHTKRIYVPELDRHVKIKLSAKAITSSSLAFSSNVSATTMISSIDGSASSSGWA